MTEARQALERWWSHDSWCADVQMQANCTCGMRAKVNAALDTYAAEATAAAEQRLRSDVADAICFVERHPHTATEPSCDRSRGIAEAVAARLNYRDRPASPRQGEPVAVARFIEAVRRSALLGRREPTVMLRMWVRYAEVIQRHYAALSEPAEASEP